MQPGLAIAEDIQKVRTYLQLDISPDSSYYGTSEGYIFQRFSVANRIFLFGSFSAFNPDTTFAGPRMIVKSAQDSVLYASPGFSDSETVTPLFYKTQAVTDPLLLFVGVGGLGSWGNALFRATDHHVESLGFLNVATFDSTDLPGNITPHSKIFLSNDTLLIEFPDETILLNPSGDQEEEIKGTNVFYRYTERKLELVRR